MKVMHQNETRHPGARGRSLFKYGGEPRKRVEPPPRPVLLGKYPFMKLLASLVLLAIAALPGCASITQDEGATIAFAAPNCPEGTECTLRNKKGSWSLMVPGTITIPKSDDTLHIT